jgi:hypothetical protein
MIRKIEKEYLSGLLMGWDNPIPSHPIAWDTFDKTVIP